MMGRVSIDLSEQQTDALKKWNERRAKAFGEQELEPPEYELVVTLSGPYGASLRAVCGASVLELGEVHADAKL